MKYDRKDDLIEWLKCGVFVVTIFAISTGLDLLADYLDKVL